MRHTSSLNKRREQASGPADYSPGAQSAQGAAAPFSSSRKRPPPRSVVRVFPESGFSLLEVLIVVAVTLVMMALAAKSMMTAVYGYRLSSAARNIASLAQVAKIKATGRATRYRLVIDTSARTYQMQRWTGTAWAPDTVDNVAVNYELPPGVNFVTAAVSTPPPGQSAGPDTEMPYNARGLLVSGSAPVNSRCFYLTGQAPRGMAVCSNLAGATTVYRMSGSTWEVQ